jgi:hypothetical protein
VEVAGLFRCILLVVFDLVFEPFPSGLPGISLQGFFAFFGGELAPWEVFPPPFGGACVDRLFKFFS